MQLEYYIDLLTLRNTFCSRSAQPSIPSGVECFGEHLRTRPEARLRDAAPLRRA
jgi:hypothetical protein